MQQFCFSTQGKIQHVLWRATCDAGQVNNESRKHHCHGPGTIVSESYGDLHFKFSSDLTKQKPNKIEYIYFKFQIPIGFVAVDGKTVESCPYATKVLVIFFQNDLL